VQFRARERKEIKLEPDHKRTHTNNKPHRSILPAATLEPLFSSVSAAALTIFLFLRQFKSEPVELNQYFFIFTPASFLLLLCPGSERRTPPSPSCLPSETCTTCKEGTASNGLPVSFSPSLFPESKKTCQVDHSSIHSFIHPIDV